MEEINHDLSSEFLENEKFDFDLAFSPMKGQNISKPEEGADDEEVFFGPVGFTEQCVASRTKVLQEESNIKPLSPLTGEQVVEIFQEATKVALRLEKLSSKDSSVSNSSSSSKSSSLSNSILKLSSSSESPSWLTGKLSCGSIEGTNFLLLELDFDKENIHPLDTKEKNLYSVGKNEQQSPAMLGKNIGLNVSGKIAQNNDLLDIKQNRFELEQQEELGILKGETKMSENDKTDPDGDICKENIQPTSIEGNVNFTQNEQHMPVMLEKIRISDKIKVCEQNDSEKELKKEANKEKVEERKSYKIPIVNARGSNLPRPGLRNSKLPKSKNNHEKSQSAFSSPIRRTGSSKKRVDVKNGPGAVKNSSEKYSQSVEKLGASQSANKVQTNVPTSLPQDARKVNRRPAKTLAKRNIFTSSESLDKLGAKESKSKLPVSQRSKIPGPRPRRRRSISLSSLDSSQSSGSSQTSQDDNSSKLTRPSTKIPTTKASLAASFGLTQRSKLQDTTADKKPQPLKALPRPGFTSSTKNSKANTKIANPMPPPSTEQYLKDDKIPMAATPRSSSLLPVARRRSSFKSSLSSTSSREGSPPKDITPSKSEPTSSTTKRRSAIPTPGRNAPSSASRRVLRSSGDDSILLSLSPASKAKKNQESTRQTNRKLIPDDEPHSVKSSQTVDNLLECDDNNPIFEDVIPLQPEPVTQSDLIDLSGL